MKRIKKITSIALITILCFSILGCYGDFFENCLNKTIYRKSIEQGKFEIEKQLQVLDAFPKEVEGYKLILDYTNDLYKVTPYQTNNSWEAFEYYYWDEEYIYVEDQKKITVYVTFESINDNNYIAFYLKEYYQDELVAEKTFKVSPYKVNKAYSGIEGLFSRTTNTGYGCLYYVDGVWFLITTYTDEYLINREKHYVAIKDFPPLFHLIDFEKECIYYAGYADGWYENAQERNFSGGWWYYRGVKVEKE